MSARELQPFSPRTLLALIALGATAFIAMAYFMIAGENGHAQRPASPTTTSRSAIGYRAFIELLRHFDLPAVAPTPAQLRRASLRIVLAPRTRRKYARRSLPARGRSPSCCRNGQASAQPLSDSVADAQLLESDQVREFAREISADMEIVRPKSAGAWRNDGVQGEPKLSRPQLVRSPSLCPVVSSDAGILIGRLCRRPNVLVLADPDLLANHGLWRGDNAVLAMSAVANLRKGAGPIVALERVTELRPRAASGAWLFPSVRADHLHRPGRDRHCAVVRRDALRSRGGRRTRPSAGRHDPDRYRRAPAAAKADGGRLLGRYAGPADARSRPPAACAATPAQAPARSVPGSTPPNAAGKRN